MFAPPTDGPALLGAVIDAFVAFLDERPDFKTIAYGGRYVSSAAREGHSRPEGGLAGMVKGFLVEAEAVAGARDISSFGGWRAFMAQEKAVV